MRTIVPMLCAVMLSCMTADSLHAQDVTRAVATRHIIVDADPGTDDCFAILLALRSPDISVDAITIVFGNVTVVMGVQNALRLVEVADHREVPVVPGAQAPLVRKFTMESTHGPDGMLGQSSTFAPVQTRPATTSAVEMIRRIVRKDPGKVSIVAVGPLTNIALALREDPQIAPMIQQIVLMGGSLSGGNKTPAAESNIWHDPEAAQIVFHSGVPITMVGLDVTRKMEFKENYVRELEASKDPVAQAAARLARAGMHAVPNPNGGSPMMAGRVLHDPLAMASFIDPSIVTTKKCHVEIEVSGEFTAGETVAYCDGRLARTSDPLLGNVIQPGTGLLPDGVWESNAAVATDVDVDKYFRLIMPRLLKTESALTDDTPRPVSPQ